MGNVYISVELTSDEQRILVGQMNNCRKKLLEEDIPTEDIDSIILKTINAKPAKRKWWKDER